MQRFDFRSPHYKESSTYTGDIYYQQPEFAFFGSPLTTLPRISCPPRSDDREAYPLVRYREQEPSYYQDYRSRFPEYTEPFEQGLRSSYHPRKHASFDHRKIPFLHPRSMDNSALFFRAKRENRYLENQKKVKASSQQPKSENLKDIERKFTKNGKRTIFSYNKNVSAALELPVKDDKLQENKDDVAILLSLSKNSILEHAARRIDLFFYTLIAYHNTHLKPIQGRTKLQHGKGRSDFYTKDKAITSASHSSILPELVDAIITKQIPVKADFNLPIKTGLVSATHYMDSLNATVELPKFVNDFDSEIEITYSGRQKSLEILEKVARNEIDPIEGLKEFLEMLQEIFSKIESGNRFEKLIIFDKSVEHDKALTTQRDLLDLTKQGTFGKTWSKETKTVNENYIFMLLRLSKNEIAICKSNKEKRGVILQEKMLTLQHEIHETPSSHAVVRPR